MTTGSTKDHPERNHYEILGVRHLEKSSKDLSKQDLKQAYHRALLQNHPDKSSSGGSSNSTTDTIDEITLAYKILSDPIARAEYDNTLRLTQTKNNSNYSGRNEQDKFRTGLEIVDLEDMNMEEVLDTQQQQQQQQQQHQENIWTRSCRCGDNKGFSVTEQDLEREADSGEIVIGCRGCSLWLKILFAVSEDAADGEGP